MDNYDAYLLTVKEAAKYFRIGENRLRRLIRNDPRADYFIMVGNRFMINRKLFEKYIDNTRVI